jgi:hypothetical protein
MTRSGLALDENLEAGKRRPRVLCLPHIHLQAHQPQAHPGGLEVIPQLAGQSVLLAVDRLQDQIPLVRNSCLKA